MEIDLPCKVFQGVRFILFGFNHIDEKRVRSKLVGGGGVDVGQYGPSCTHVIVNKLIYGDPVCVAARNDGKLLVTGLWVDHSFDTGLRVDATSVLYRPLRELNGIPGAKRLIMCLTGYQRQDRDDIMTMVGLMGAQFSKPLVANKVTHLICYKFEGEKYELARKLRSIKLVNHRWLEDCLKEWMILPESNYNISGYDMEILEAEAKDSEEEINSNINHFGGRNMKSPNTLRFGLQSTSEISNTLPVSKTLNDPTIIVDSKSISAVPTNNSKFIYPGKLDKHDVTGAPTCWEGGVFNDAQCSMPSDANIRTSESEKQKVKNELMSTPLNATKSPQLCATSYSRRTLWKSPLPLQSGERLDNVDVSSKIAVGEMKDNIGLVESLAKSEPVKGVALLGFEQNPWKGPDLLGTGDSNDGMPLKWTTDVCNDVSKSQNMNEDTKSCTVNSPPGNEEILEWEIKRFSLDNDDSSKYYATNSQHRASITETSKSIKKPLTPLTCDLPFGKSVFSSTEDIGDDSKKTHQAPFQFSEKDMSPDKPDVLNNGFGSAGDVVGKTKETDKQQQVVLDTSESDKDTEAKKLACPTELNFSTVGNDDSHTKQNRLKKFAKKSLGSRTKLGTANQKGSIILNKVTSSNGSISTHGNNEKCFSSMLEISPQTVSIEVQKVMETADLAANVVNFHKYEAMDEDDKTAAPETNEADFEQILDEEKFEMLQLTSDVDKPPKEAALEVQSNNIKSSVLDDAIPSDIIKGVTEPGEPVSIRNVQLDESRVGDDNTLEMNAGDKCLMEKKMLRNSSTKMKSERGKDGKASCKKIEVTGKKKPQLLAAGPKTKVHTLPDDKSDKENEPFIVGDQTSNKHCLEKPTVKSIAKQRKTTQKSTEISADSSMVVKKVLREVKSEPACFIFSGHRLQRKEFQQVIRRLKGRFCRDSHQWSYQATHFITPDPIRRTEKFFAAAASGRWILKPDYLTDCSQAGRLLKEEPYEWYKNGLTEDGAINLEAPRKWRLLRGRTGHGALYGMRIIIYGECIAPPLDTLKRAVKSGDGTILATSPSYTRFLNSGVDFAVVSPGMPRSDLWVQEFLNNEIPCVAADYLVEYVCKPGYPLEKLVLYNTHAWAEKSFTNLKRRAEEVVEDLSPPDDNSDDLACQECGSRDRGEVMLICGNEDGSNGCGVGMHIDCCNPPLLDIPDGDWFCPECISCRNKNSPNKRKKGVSEKRK